MYLHNGRNGVPTALTNRERKAVAKAGSKSRTQTNWGGEGRPHGNNLLKTASVAAGAGAGGRGKVVKPS